MAKPVALLIHGMFMSPRCWEEWIPYFEEHGVDAKAPPWPMHEEPPRAQRTRHPDSQLGTLTLAQVVDAIAEVASALPEPPALVGHSMGGLIVQLLLQRGIGRCGVAIDSAPPKGVVSLKWSFIKSNWGVVSPFVEARDPFLPTLEQFRYAFCHTLSTEDAERVYEKLVVPESRLVGRGPTTPYAKIDFNKPHAPLLFLSGELDHIIPASLNRSNFGKYAKESGVTELQELQGRTHFTLGDTGWEAVADAALAFIKR